jgi:hypothetical protein
MAFAPFHMYVLGLGFKEPILPKNTRWSTLLGLLNTLAILTSGTLPFLL